MEQWPTGIRGSLLLPDLETRRLRVERPETAATPGRRWVRPLGVAWMFVYWHFCTVSSRFARYRFVQWSRKVYTSSNLLLVTVQINKLYKKPSIFSLKWRYASRTKCPLSFVKKMNSEAPGNITREHIACFFHSGTWESYLDVNLCRVDRRDLYLYRKSCEPGVAAVDH